MPECRETDCCNEPTNYHSDQDGFNEAQNCLVIQILTEELPAAVTGEAYSFPLTVFGGTAPFVWALVSGSLPDGLTLSSDGIISGTSTELEEASFTVSVTDAIGNVCTADLTLLSSSLSLDLVAYYRFELAGEDSSGHSRDLNTSSGPTFGQSGLIGNALYFAGSGNLRRLNESGFAYNGGGLTICGWTKVLLQEFFGMGISLDWSWGQFQVQILYLPAGSMSISWGRGVAEVTKLPADPTAFTFFRAWHDPSDNKFRLQIGDSNGLSTVGVSATAMVPSGGATQGDFTFQVTSAHDLYWDEVALWHRVITDDEAEFLFNSGAGNIIPI